MPLSNLLSQLKRIGGLERIRAIEARCERIQEALGRIEARQTQSLAPDQWSTAEFRVFSQWGEDGILQQLLRYIPVSRKTFIEFGVETYQEANTRFLLIHDNWSGLVMDGSIENIEFIKSDDLYWRYNLKAEQAFITRENINDLIRRNGISGEIGLLSVDIDGNDYWVWEAIDVVSPSIVVVEYNARFGPDRAVTIPYRADFIRTKAHYSNLYYGASLAALCVLARRKGYAFVGCNMAGNNAFFVRNDLKPAALPEITPQQGYRPSKFRESRDPQGKLTFLSAGEELAILEKLPLFEISQTER
jgi:hypothetical protein